MATYTIKSITLPSGDICNLIDSTGAQVNQNAFSNVTVDSTTIAAGSTTDTIQLAAGTGISLTPDATNKKITIDTTGISTQRTSSWYGTSSTAAGTAAKEVTCSNYVPAAGDIISILFSTANTAATPTLNINSLGAKTIYAGSATLNATTNVLKWSANTLLTFVYDGTNYRYISSRAAATVIPPDGAGTWYGTCGTAATTQAKTSTIANYRLMPGAMVVLRCTTANTYTSAKITLNINSTGAKDIYVNNAVTSSTNTLLWAVGDVLTFVYDGTYYRFVSSDADRKKANVSDIPTTVSQLTNDAGYVTSSILTDLFKIVQYSYSYTVAANSNINLSNTNFGELTPDGYEPFSFANVTTGNAGVVIRSMQPRLPSGSTALLSLRNETSASVTASATIQMIYVKTGAIATS